MFLWQFIQLHLSQSQPVMLLYVLTSEGSSPGRQGFSMAVAADGSFCGTIGGGIMEFKLVEKAKAMLAKPVTKPQILWQHHDKKSADQSGMICSGSQLNAFISLETKDLATVTDILKSLETGAQKVIQLSPNGLALLLPHENNQPLPNFQNEPDLSWQYQTLLLTKPIIHIIGGGHVGLALSEIMQFLGFYVIIYDNRPALTTLEENKFADEKHVVDYATIGNLFTHHQQDYVAIMTVGYRTDKIVLKQLLGKQFFYMGLMGSEAKINTLFAELVAEGCPEESLQSICSPIGLMIYSKTAQEIAVSIAAEIIKEKNKQLPTGRTKGLEK